MAYPKPLSEKSMNCIRQKKLDEYMSIVQGTFAEKIFRNLRFDLFTGR